ncbi:MAG: sulfite exporter TauE/SafE family protein [Actinomycetota bacterium]|nr:sulfite exporter TauE/SafE family protein [Actinomycetota bacterium]
MNDILSNNLVLIAFASFVISAIVLYSGFGLTTLLMPVFALFFPLPIAIAAAAVIHLVSNLFKFFLFKRNINWPTVFKFGVPAMFAAIIGSLLLSNISADEMLLARIIGGLIIFFALFELLPVLKKIVIPPKWLSLGGLISGFFGGLSGHQGAIRSAFLLKLKPLKTPTLPLAWQLPSWLISIV